MMRVSYHKRTLAVDLARRGFGYAVLDAKGRLVDWGVRRVRGDKAAECMTRIMDLLEWYAPEMLVLEDCDATTSRRAPRIRALAREVRRMAKAVDVAVTSTSWQQVRGVFGRSVRATKDQIAARVAQLYPIMSRHLPPKRKIWMSEDERMNMFDAIALALTARALAVGRPAA
jgi:RNase H-fold protein (predicted Holliday junction resolvase)